MKVRKQLDIYTKSKNGENYYQVVIYAYDKYYNSDFNLEVLISIGGKDVVIECNTYDQAEAIFKNIVNAWMNLK